MNDSGSSKLEEELQRALDASQRVDLTAIPPEEYEELLALVVSRRDADEDARLTELLADADPRSLMAVLQLIAPGSQPSRFPCGGEERRRIIDRAFELAREGGAQPKTLRRANRSRRLI